MIDMVTASDYVILCNRMMFGKIDEEKERYIKEACNLINALYNKFEIYDMVNNNEIPNVLEILYEGLKNV